MPLGVAEAVARPAVVITPAVIGAILYSGALAAGIANVFVFIAIRYVGPTRDDRDAVPRCRPGAVVLGAIFLAEPIGPPQVVGGAVIVLGVWLTRRSSILPSSMRARLSSAA